jgi:phosphopantetheine--protein transferase-like protein
MRRYADKILTSDEIENWESEPSPQRLFLFWACKEAAFKVWSRDSSNRSFAPKSFEVKIKGSEIEAVHLPTGKRYIGRSKIEQEVIHVVLQDEKARPFLEMRSKVSEGIDEKHLASAMSDFQGTEGFVRKEGRVPSWVVNNKVYPMSISHCGLTTSWVVSLKEALN